MEEKQSLFGIERWSRGPITRRQIQQSQYEAQEEKEKERLALPQGRGKVCFPLVGRLCLRP